MTLTCPLPKLSIAFPWLILLLQILEQAVSPGPTLILEPALDETEGRAHRTFIPRRSVRAWALLTASMTRPYSAAVMESSMSRSRKVRSPIRTAWGSLTGRRLRPPTVAQSRLITALHAFFRTRDRLHPTARTAATVGVRVLQITDT